MTTVTSSVVPASEALQMVRKHRGPVELEANLIHDMVGFKVTKSVARQFLDEIENGGYQVHVIVAHGIMTLVADGH